MLKLAVQLAQHDPLRAQYYLNAPGAFSVTHEAEVALRGLEPSGSVSIEV